MDSFQNESRSNIHANEMIEIINSGHITMPPDLKSSSKKTYTKHFYHNTSQRRLNKSVIQEENE